MEGSEMWVAECPRCQRRRLYSTHRVRAVRNLAAGIIAVELSCYCGHPLTVLTGRRLTGSGDLLLAGGP
jgi:hypothetical protein